LSAISRAKVLLLALFLCWTQAALADTEVPELKGRVVDLTNTLNASYIETLNQRIRSFEQRKGSQIAVLIVPTTQPETIEEYSIRAAEAWKIGRKKIDDGALLVIAKNDHKLRIEVGYGLEGALTDITSRRIIDEVIAPRFKEGDFAGGISEGLTRMIGVIDGEPLPKPKPEASHGPDVDWMSGLSAGWPFILVGALMIGSFLRAVFGRLLGASAAGGVFAVLGWFIVGSLIAGAVMGGVAFLLVLIVGDSASLGVSPRGGRRSSDVWSSGWSSGSSSSGWSSGSSSSDSDSGGGGGSFGGGGASGSW
jgi:uncharacterized protein